MSCIAAWRQVRTASIARGRRSVYITNYWASSEGHYAPPTGDRPASLLGTTPRQFTPLMIPIRTGHHSPASLHPCWAPVWVGYTSDGGHLGPVCAAPVRSVQPMVELSTQITLSRGRPTLTARHLACTAADWGLRRDREIRQHSRHLLGAALLPSRTAAGRTGSSSSARTAERPTDGRTRTAQQDGETVRERE